MPENLFSTLDILSAYKKLKHYFYYDNTSLFVRKRISDFEKSIEQNVSNEKSFDQALQERLEAMAIDISNKSKLWWRRYLENAISYKVTPKSFFKMPISLLTNRSQEKNLNVPLIS